MFLIPQILSSSCKAHTILSNPLQTKVEYPIAAAQYANQNCATSVPLYPVFHVIESRAPAAVAQHPDPRNRKSFCQVPSLLTILPHPTFSSTFSSPHQVYGRLPPRSLSPNDVCLTGARPPLRSPTFCRPTRALITSLHVPLTSWWALQYHSSSPDATCLFYSASSAAQQPGSHCSRREAGRIYVPNRQWQCCRVVKQGIPPSSEVWEQYHPLVARVLKQRNVYRASF